MQMLDAVTVLRAQKGDRDALHNVLEAAYPRTYRYALRLCRERLAAEELTQETMFRAIRSLATLRDATQFISWILTIATNVWRSDRGRKSSCELPDEIED